MGGLVDFYGTHTFWVWIAVAAAILAFEVAAGSGWLLWPSASAAVMAFVSLFTSSAALEIGLFAALTIVTTLTARKFWPRATNSTASAALWSAASTGFPRASATPCSTVSRTA